MKIALAQINTKIGDFDKNSEKIIDFITKAKEKNADLVIFPELTITGYPPRDLLDFKNFVSDNIKCLKKIMPYTSDIGVVCGFVDFNKEDCGRKYRNAAVLIHNGEIISKHYKSLLPFYDVFDETRYFEPAKEVHPVIFKGKKLGITICEDIWNDKDHLSMPLYANNPIETLFSQGIDILINLSASPFWLNKSQDRHAILSNIAQKYDLPIVYVNQVGGNDDLLFDGSSIVIDKEGKLQTQAEDFKEDLVIYDTELNKGEIKQTSTSQQESLFKALTTGLRDYCHKSGFYKTVLGLSGGIDSAVTAVLAAEALGKENVLGITMPSMYSSDGSISDSEVLAQNLDIEFKNIPIKDYFYSYVNNIQNGDLAMDLAEENLQARIRGNILMLHSNRYGRLLLSTGNKSEMAVGYCTLYGDMAGGLSVLSDVPKVMVYKLAKYINRNKEIIPDIIITKPPSAELRPDQKDQDSLPPYEILDDILKMYIEENKSFEEIAQKYNADTVKDVIRKVNNNEYKRRQASLGLKVTTKAFGSGRRFPIVQGYKFY